MGEGRLQAYHAEGALFQPLCLFLGAVGGVVRGDHINGAVEQPFQQGLPVLRGAQRGDSS